MKKLTILALAVCSIVAVDFVIPKVLPLVNKDNYFLGFEKFLTKAEQTKGQKRIILVGGSSLAWGVSAEQLTQSLGVLTLNSGIAAGVGYKNFFRNIDGVVNKKTDIFVISPEYSIVSESGLLHRSKEFCYIAIYVRDTLPFDCVGYSLSQLFNVSPLLNRNKKVAANEEYLRNGFNDFGDYVYRPIRQQELDLESLEKCNDVNLYDLRKNYIPFIEKLLADGYNIVYIPNFLPDVSCADSSKIDGFHSVLYEEFGVPPFVDQQLLFDEEYFYNTAYHLTNKGVGVKTAIFHNHLYQLINSRLLGSDNPQNADTTSKNW
jgi:hypothetical protein